MDALVVYGSLINKSELTKGGCPLDSTCSVVLRGFKRVFCQEPSWRPDRGEQRAVLNVIGCEHHWLNALLISGLDDRFLADVDEREKGYDRTKVAPSYVRGYHPLSTKPRNIYTHAGKADKQNDSILPNASYLSICLEGAKQRGQDFYNEFLDSTFVKDGILLRTYLR
jgi:hypothetical protein